jgi:hypothetical protein
MMTSGPAGRVLGARRTSVDPKPTLLMSARYLPGIHPCNGADRFAGEVLRRWAYSSHLAFALPNTAERRGLQRHRVSRVVSDRPRAVRTVAPTRSARA